MSTISAAVMARSWRWHDKRRTPEPQPEEDMSAVLKNLSRQPNGNIALKAFLDHRNYCEPALMTEAEVAARIMRSMRAHGLKEAAMHEAIQKGFDAARENPS
jgi:hypothetical protein